MGTARTVAGQLVVIASFLWLSGCGSPSSPSGNTLTVSGVVVSGPAALTAIGQTTQLAAMAAFSNGTSQNVTSTATWQSSNTNIATVTTGGLVTAVNFGQVSITAAYQGASGPLTVTVQLNLTGTWKGSSADSTGILQLSFVLVQSGATVTGTGTYAGSSSGTGTFIGAVGTTSNTLTFSIGGSGGGCTFSATGIGSVTANKFSGSYTGTNSCYGPLANGLVALTEQ
jgi:hypothetical protein